MPLPLSKRSAKERAPLWGRVKESFQSQPWDFTGLVPHVCAPCVPGEGGPLRPPCRTGWTLSDKLLSLLLKSGRPLEAESEDASQSGKVSQFLLPESVRQRSL